MKKPTKTAKGNHDPAWLLIALKDLHVEKGFNVRADMGDLIGLSQDIAANGLKRPPEVREKGGKYVLVEGHRRLAAIRLANKTGAKIEKITCLREARGATEADRIFSVLSNNNGLPLDPFEECEAFSRILGFGTKIKDIARRIGHGQDYVETRLALKGAIPELRQACKDGRVSMSNVARLSAQGPEFQREYLKRFSKRIESADVAASEGRFKPVGKRVLNRELNRFPEGQLSSDRIVGYRLGLQRALGYTVTLTDLGIVEE